MSRATPSLLLSSAILAGLVAAQPASAEFALSLYSGFQSAPHSRVSGNDPAGAGPFSFGAGWEGRPFAAPPHYGLRATWWRDENWGFGVDFNHTKVYADAATLTASGFQVLEFSDGLNNLTLNVTRRWTKPGRRWSPYVGAGLGVVIPHVEVQSQAGSPLTFEYQMAGPSAALNAGIEYSFNQHWAMFGEYKGTYSQVKADLTGGGSLKTNVITNALNIGLTYRF